MMRSDLLMPPLDVPNSTTEAQITAFLVETGTNATMRAENMAARNVEELVAVANRHGFAFTPADMVRHQAQTILSFSDAELDLYAKSAPWWQLCLEAYALYGK
jgi:predicted ribosomally synthesized peptide with nif11-like leader